VVSFTSSMNSASGCLPTEEVAAARRTYSQQQLGAKVEMVYNLLSMLGTHDREDMSRTLLAMSSSPDSCIAMRQSGRFQRIQESVTSCLQDLSQFTKHSYLAVILYQLTH
jgi:cytidylate kinase